MISRRTFFASSAVLASASGGTTRLADLEARITRHDLKDISKDDLPTPCMVVDQDILESNLKRMADHCNKTDPLARPRQGA